MVVLQECLKFFKHEICRDLIDFRVVCDYMNDNVKYVVSDKDWDSTFDEASNLYEMSSLP